MSYLAAGMVLVLAAAACPLESSRPPDFRTDCPNPAPLLGKPSQVPGYIVVFREGTAAAAVTAELARKYGFIPRHVYEHALQGFAAELSDAALAGIRCEPVVKHVEYEGIVTVR